MSQRGGEADVLDGSSGSDPSELRRTPAPPATTPSVLPNEPSATTTPADAAALPQGFVVEETSIEDILPRLARLERRARIQSVALLLALATAGYFAIVHFVDEDVIVRQTLMESKEITLLDNDGTARLFIRMYSKVPVLQIMDSNGKPRMSMGLRFDDTPFLDLSDRRGRTRATFEMTEDDAPALRLFDENGNPTFNIN